MRTSTTIAAISLGLAASATSSYAQYASSDTACTRHYKVQKGDTCDKIGQKTMTSTYQIMALNLPESGPSCYELQIDADLCLGRYGNDCQLVHRVQGDETCESIAGQYGISVERLRQNNPSMRCSDIYDGLMLCTLSGLVRPTADKKLPIYYAAPEHGQMPMGKALVAKNAPAPSASASAPAAARAVKHLQHHHHPRHHKQSL